MEVLTVATLRDNLSYIVYSKATRKGCLIDPVQPKKLLHTAQQHSIDLVASLTTHHHHDHSGGNGFVRQMLPNVPVVGGRGDRCPHVTLELGAPNDDNVLRIDDDLQITAVLAPCHTRGHLLYIASHPGADDEQQQPQPQAVFTGDTLFVGGCGRFFEGTAEEMCRAMAILRQLPASVKVYPGHEYTASNLAFAATVEPENRAVQKKLEWAKRQRSAGLNTVPSTIAEEIETNPFMRIDHPDVQSFTQQTHPTRTMGRLRELKNSFGLGVVDDTL